jgi:hypothetical protein
MRQLSLARVVRALGSLGHRPGWLVLLAIGLLGSAAVVRGCARRVSTVDDIAAALG